MCSSHIGRTLYRLIPNGFQWYRKPFLTIHNIAIWTIWDSMGQIYGTKWALLFVETVPLLCQIRDRSWQKWDFFYYWFVMVFLWVSYRFLIEFNKNSHVNLLIIIILGVEALCSGGKLGCGALLIVLVFITKYYNFWMDTCVIII